MLKDRIKTVLSGTPLERLIRRVLKATRRSRRSRFTTSGDYWERRYASHGNSGAGSYGRLARFKAEVLNDFVERHGIASVIEFGSGDGHQLTLAEYPGYTGVDVSETAVRACRERFAGAPEKTFLTLSEYDGRKADLALSLDVIYHLVEDETFENYMARLFDAADRYVVVYSSNKNERHPAQHVRHRKFTDWVDANRGDYRLDAHVPNRFPFDPEDPDNTSFAGFYFFEKLD